MVRYFFLFFFILLSFSLTGCKETKKQQTRDNIDQKTMIQTDHFTLLDLNNNKYTFIEKENGFNLKNNSKILIIDIFATWCPPCQAEVEVLSNLQKKYKEHIKVIGISIEKNIPKEKLLEFKQTFNISYTLISPSPKNQYFIDHITKKILQKTNNIPLPFMVMYKDSQLKHYYIGATEEEFIQSDIKQLLGK